MNGLDEEYNEQVVFLRLNADSPGGSEAIKAYNLRGHPAFVLLNPNGEVLWTGVGEQTRETLGHQLQATLGEQ